MAEEWAKGRKEMGRQVPRDKRRTREYSNMNMRKTVNRNLCMFPELLPIQRCHDRYVGQWADGRANDGGLKGDRGNNTDLGANRPR